LKWSVSGMIAGVPVRGIAHILTTDGVVVDGKTASRKPSGLAADHALQLATYAQLVPGASGETRVDTLVGTKDPQLVQIDHTPGEAGRRLVGADLPAGRRGHRWRFVPAEPRLERLQPAVLRVCRGVRAGIRRNGSRVTAAIARCAEYPYLLVRVFVRWRRVGSQAFPPHNILSPLVRCASSSTDSVCSLTRPNRSTREEEEAPDPGERFVHACGAGLRFPSSVSQRRFFGENSALARRQKSHPWKEKSDIGVFARGQPGSRIAARGSAWRRLLALLCRNLGLR
jgi:hypothetical protein